MQRGSYGRKIEPPGTVVQANRNNYTILSLLGQGGMGDVYKVHEQNHRAKVFAMKTERNDADPYMARLKVETNVFDAIQTANASVDKSHFVYMHDKGKTRTFKYYIMDVIGHSLEDIRKRILNSQVPLSNVISIARQTIKSVESLHAVGWLHRDMKPGNFAVGLPPRDHVVYMIDFGTARKYRDDTGRLRVPRARASAPCSIWYCSLRCHDMQEQARRDDLETWLYMMLDLIWQGNLSWWGMKMKDMSKIVEGKKMVMQRPKEAIAKKAVRMPEPLVKIIEMINNMEFTDGADYVLIERVLQQIVVEHKLDMNEPMAWIGKEMPPMPATPKPKESELKEVSAVAVKRKQSVEQGGAVKAKEPTEKEMKHAIELQKMYEELGQTKTIEEVMDEVRRRIKSKGEKREDEEYSDDDYSEEETKDRKRKKSKTRKSSHGRGRGRRNRDPKGEEADDERDENKSPRRRRRKEKGAERASKAKEPAGKAEKKEDAVDAKKIPDAKKN